MGNHGSFYNRDSTHIYLSDRGSDWSCDTSYLSGPKFRENEYRQALQQYGISHADYVSAVTKADKEGHKALVPCRIIAFAGISVSLVFMGLVYALVFGAFGGRGIPKYICNVPTYGLYSNQCQGRNMTNPYTDEDVCCNFWCCGGDPNSDEIYYTKREPQVQTPKLLELKAKIPRGECYYLKAHQESDQRTYWAESNCQGHGHVEVEGEYSKEETRGFELPIQPYYFMWMPVVLLIAACIVPRMVYNNNCYRKAILKVFREHFAGKVEVSWITGSKHVPNFVRLHTNRQQTQTNGAAVTLVQAPACTVTATAVVTGSAQQVVPVATATAVPVAAQPVAVAQTKPAAAMPVVTAQTQPAAAMPVATAQVML